MLRHSPIDLWVITHYLIGMAAIRRDLLAEIDAFLAQSGLTPTKFGVTAVNDGHLVANLRKGNSVTLRTADKV